MANERRAAVSVETCDGDVVRVVLGGDSKYNTFTGETKQQLPRVFDDLARDARVRAIILQGSGEHFCAGADVDCLMPDPDRSTPLGMRQLVQDANRVARAIRGIDKPVIAAVDGAAVGAGLSLALLCDIIYASDRARFVAGFVNFSFIPDVGATYLLPRLIGMGNAKEFLFTGGTMTAQEAQQKGLVSRVLAPERLHEETLLLARRIASMPTAGLGLTKRALHENWDATFEAALEREAMTQPLAMTLADFREAYSAFREKRRPAFGGSLDLTLGPAGPKPPMGERE